MSMAYVGGAGEL